MAMTDATILIIKNQILHVNKEKWKHKLAFMRIYINEKNVFSNKKIKNMQNESKLTAIKLI